MNYLLYLYQPDSAVSSYCIGIKILCDISEHGYSVHEAASVRIGGGVAGVDGYGGVGDVNDGRQLPGG